MRERLRPDNIVLLRTEDLEYRINTLICVVIFRINSEKKECQPLNLPLQSSLPTLNSHEIIISISFQCLCAIIDSIVQRNHVAMILQNPNEGNKVAALQSVLVQIIGTAITRRDHHDSLIEQMCKQSLEDHRVRNVRDLELVKTNQPTLLHDLLCHRFRWIERIRLVVATVDPLLALLLRVNVLVHLRHERVKVDTPFSVDLERNEEVLEIVLLFS